MAELELIVFDDAVARDWYPFTLTRPAGELLLGTMTLRERLERVTGARCAGQLTRPELAGFDEPDTPPVIEAATPPVPRTRLFISSRCILHWDVQLDSTRESTLRVGDQIAGWVVPAQSAPPSDDDLLTPRAERGTVQSVGGGMIDNVWDLIRLNLDHVASDILHLHPSEEPGAPPAYAHLVGDYPLIRGSAVTIEPGVVFDVSAGPVWLADGVQVRALSRVAGPFYAGPDTTLLGGSFTACSIGPRCKVHGELEESIIVGFSNKAHDGFLGHAYVGKWVNLGAMTTNSDLKNNYSNVRITTPGGEVDSGMMKLGALIGDHVKTAIGTLLNTGTVIGPGANVLDTRPPKHVLPFSWGDAVFDLEKFLATAERAMQRRAVELSAAQRALLTRAWHAAVTAQAQS